MQKLIFLKLIKFNLLFHTVIGGGVHSFLTLIYLLNESEIFTGKSHTKTLPMGQSIWQG